MTTTREPLRPDPNKPAMIPTDDGGWRNETDAEYLQARLNPQQATSATLIANAAKRPAVAAQVGRFDWAVNNGVRTQIHIPPVKAREEGPLRVCVYAVDMEDKGPAYITAEAARKFAWDILAAAELVAPLPDGDLLP
jgi:hypothetical protein